MSSRVESCKLTNMCLLKKDNQILVQERIKDDWPGLTFPGGHVEKGEGLKDAMIREFKEETGITLLNPILKGIEEFKTKDEDRYFIFFYVASEYLGEISSNSEGEVFWIDEKDIFNYELSLDLDRILKVMEDDDISALRYYKENNEWKSVLE